MTGNPGGNKNQERRTPRSSYPCVLATVFILCLLFVITLSSCAQNGHGKPRVTGAEKLDVKTYPLTNKSSWTQVDSGTEKLNAWKSKDPLYKNIDLCQIGVVENTFVTYEFDYHHKINVLEGYDIGTGQRTWTTTTGHTVSYFHWGFFRSDRDEIFERRTVTRSSAGLRT